MDFNKEDTEMIIKNGLCPLCDCDLEKEYSDSWICSNKDCEFEINKPTEKEQIK